jgi:hypothetical protein
MRGLAAVLEPHIEAADQPQRLRKTVRERHPRRQRRLQPARAADAPVPTGERLGLRGVGVEMRRGGVGSGGGFRIACGPRCCIGRIEEGARHRVIVGDEGKNCGA